MLISFKDFKTYNPSSENGEPLEIVDTVCRHLAHSVFAIVTATEQVNNNTCHKLFVDVYKLDCSRNNVPCMYFVVANLYHQSNPIHINPGSFDDGCP